MEQEAAVDQIEGLLLLFANAADENESQTLLERLVFECSELVIHKIIEHKLNVSSSGAGTYKESQDIEDIHGDVNLRLVARLNALRADRDGEAIDNFVGYVAAMTRNAVHDYLRRKYPQRHSLENRIRYFLTHQQRFALWESNAKEFVCGFADWKQDKTALARRCPIQDLREAFEGFVHGDAFGQDLRLEPSKLAGALTVLFERIRKPVRLNDLINVLGERLGIKDQPSQSEQHFPDIPASIPNELEQRSYLQSVWTEICQLPPMQRAALLLTMQDVSLFELTGVASVRQLAEVLNMNVEDLAALWNRLPLDDAGAAKLLGIDKRQRVINLRKAARARLARRMKTLESG